MKEPWLIPSVSSIQWLPKLCTEDMDEHLNKNTCVVPDA